MTSKLCDLCYQHYMNNKFKLTLTDPEIFLVEIQPIIISGINAFHSPGPLDLCPKCLIKVLCIYINKEDKCKKTKAKTKPKTKPKNL